jgi:deoxyribonuclease-4
LGSAGEQDLKIAQEKIIENLQKIYDGYQGTAQLTLEIGAGSGKIMGVSLDEMKNYFEKLENQGLELGFCFDTCHAFATGYDLRTPEKVQRVFREMNEKIDLKRLKCIHFNDSKTEFNSKKDRHEHIGEGLIGKDGMRAVVKKAEKLNLNIYLETNHDKIKKDLEVTKGFLK